MKLGDLIQEYRDAHELSQRQFASQCDLSNGYISILEKGTNPSTGKPVTPTLPQLQKLANGMGMTLSELFEKVDDMPIDIGINISLTPESNDPAPADGNLSFEEFTLIQKYRCLDERGKAAVLNVLEHEYNSLPGETAVSTAKEA